MVLLDKLLPKLKERDSRVLIFSQVSFEITITCYMVGFYCSCFLIGNKCLCMQMLYAMPCICLFVFFFFVSDSVVVIGFYNSDDKAAGHS
jgi:hypothetical protein